jgi:hypothetical protein
MVTVKRSKNKSNAAPTKRTAPIDNVRARNLEIQDVICSRAYRLYEQRGREHGHDLDDWLCAKSEGTVQ